jgi:hypothetical protein
MRALVALVLVACGSRSARAPAPVTPPSPTAVAELRGMAVGDDSFYRSVLYTWTTPENIAALRTSKKLLTATAKSGGYKSPFNRAIERIADPMRRGYEVAEKLMTWESLNRRRYAWPTPFATVRGMTTMTYGSALIRIELRPEAWIGRFEPAAKDPFHFVDRDGNFIPNLQVAGDPDRIGAIFHVRVEPSQPVKFREYIVTNEKMILRWSVATPQIRAELDREIALLRGLRDDFRDPLRPAVPAWAHAPGPDADLVTLWSAALAFDNQRYKPTPNRIDQILDALATYDPAGEPLDHTLTRDTLTRDHTP